MSFIGSMLGSSSGAGFSAASPQNSSIVSPTDIRQFQGKLDSGLNQQQSLYDQLAAQQGVQNQSSVFQQQQALANQLQAQTQGAGPNPALAQLAQATGANTANQAALMAGQRGTSGNSGLIARQAAMQGAANQQQAVGQSATLQAQQQLASQQQLQQQQGALAGLANTQVGQQQQQGNAYTQNALGATTGFLNAAAGLQSNANNANASIAGGNQKAQAGLLSGVGSALAGAFYNGGEVKGGDMSGGAGGSALSQFLSQQQGGIQDFGEPQKMGMPSPDVMMASKGAQVPGKAMVKGDSPKNDIVPAMLSPGEVVIPRHIMESKDAAKKASAFVAAIIAKNGRAKK